MIASTATDDDKTPEKRKRKKKYQGTACMYTVSTGIPDQKKNTARSPHLLELRRADHAKDHPRHGESEAAHQDPPEVHVKRELGRLGPRAQVLDDPD